MKFVAAIVVILLILVGVYIGYNKYHDYQFIESSTPYVKNSSLRLTNVLRYETASSEGITYLELFERLEESISEVEKNILQIQTIATPKQKSIAEPIETYLKGIQELQRALLSKYRKQLAKISALDRAKESVDELSQYRSDFYIKSSGQALEEAKKALAELQIAITALNSAAVKLKKLTTLMPSSLYSETIIDTAILDAVISNNKPDEVSNSEKKP